MILVTGEPVSFGSKLALMLKRAPPTSTILAPSTTFDGTVVRGNSVRQIVGDAVH